MHVITVTFEIAAGCEADFLARMKQQARDSLEHEVDCLQFDVCVASDAPDRVFLYEVYRDPAAFQTHLDSAHFKDFDATVANWVTARTVSQWHRTEEGNGPA